ncbi:MAG: di-trans,poly-cis-decaprenylcistransferase, partial [Actinobacteria bacterium]|nr:di-trans,poly-cis-decaprenylcistransferase [Actinomycetota bacterium]
IMALSYSGRWDIAQAFRSLAGKIQAGEISPDAVDADAISQHLATRDFPDPELMIRTSGEHRISNFLLWQSAYAEMVFMDVLWPDVDRRTLWQAIEIYAERNRRFGKA